MRMNRKALWLVSILIGLSFAGMLYIQARYMVDMVNMSRDQFSAAVSRSLDQASRAMERRETFSYLQRIAFDDGYHIDSVPDLAGQIPAAATGVRTLPDSLFIFPTPITIRKIVTTNLTDEDKLIGSRRTLDEAALAFQKYVREAFLYQKEVLDEVVFTVLYGASESRFEDRVDFDQLTMEVTRALKRNGITMPYHLSVNTADGREIYHCPCYESEEGEATFQAVLFRNDPVDKMGVMVVNFPEFGQIAAAASRHVFPAIIFTTVLFLTFIVAVWLNFRQKQVAEMRNDFVHNMTHEFKTPLSSISLAAQMLADRSVPKSETLLERLAGTIVSESRRLRMQVDKVLQMSLIDNHNLNLKFSDLDIASVVENVTSIFSLKVQQNGGEIITRLEAAKDGIYADEMHFTNVIYNLLDNAVKYKRNDVPLRLEIHTYNPTPHKVCVSITDNGIGIASDALRHVFDRFYRVSTGDKHDVKGFGLGLAYVKAIVDHHRGSIHCESTLGRGTTFTITLPVIEEEEA